jgi:dienelactone hydrolase
MQTAIAYAKQQSWVDKQRIAVAGKSLGSIIGWRVFQADPELKAAILLTPVCRTPPGLAQQYANAADETRPSLWLLGNADPVCVTSDLYGYLGTKPNPARIAIVDGNHALAQEGQPADPGNLALAAKIAAQFAVSAIRQEVNQIYTGK